MPRTGTLIPLAFVVLFAIIILHQLRTGCIRGRNWQISVRRDEDPRGFWNGIAIQTAIAVFIFILWLLSFSDGTF